MNALIDNHLDAVLRASGSRLSNYSMAKTLDAMREAMREAMHVTALSAMATGDQGMRDSLVKLGWTPPGGGRDEAVEAIRRRLCALQRYSFMLDRGGSVRRVADDAGAWVGFDEAHKLLQPEAVDAAIIDDDTRLQEAADRVLSYLARRAGTRGIDVEHIHGFDAGPQGGIELLGSDLALLVRAANRRKDPPAINYQQAVGRTKRRTAGEAS